MERISLGPYGEDLERLDPLRWIGTVTEVVANEIDHFMRPLVPGSGLMQRLEQVADQNHLSVRATLDQLLTFALDQAIGNPVVLHPNGQHAE